MKLVSHHSPSTLDSSEDHKDAAALVPQIAAAITGS
jgi:hypothetical protein